MRKILNLVSRIMYRLKILLNIKQEHKYNNFSIYLPADHLLPRYQKEHKQYDRFLPFLSQYVNRNECIIDIGANVGDTLAGMVEQNKDATYFCIEADESFFKYLNDNIAIIKKSIGGLVVYTDNSFVGKNITNVSLAGEGGTKHAVINDLAGGGGGTSNKRTQSNC